MSDQNFEGMLDIPKLQTWLDAQLGSSGPISVKRVLGGASNLIFRIEHGGRSYALRRPPKVLNTQTAGNIAREALLLKALAQSDIPHTRLVASCDDMEVIGAPFELLEWDPGFTAKLPLPEPFATSPELRRAMAFELIDALAKIANTDWKKIGLGDFGKPEGFLERQVDRWLGQLEHFKTREIPGLDRLVQWLRANTPKTERAGLVHGDFQFINVMYSNELPVRLSSVLDWELATIGDPLLDLGWVLCGWEEPGDTEKTYAIYIDWQDFPTRAELAARYAEKTGLSVKHLPYYLGLAAFKLAILLEGAYYRYATGKSTLPEHAIMETMVPQVIRRGLLLSGA